MQSERLWLGEDDERSRVAVRSSVRLKPAPPSVTFITNIAAHYRVRTFELIAERFDAKFVCYSKGGEANWLREHGVSTGNFRSEYLPGFSVAGVRIAPKLLSLVWSDKSDVTIKCINGKFALPIVFFGCKIRRRPLIIWTGDWSVVDSLAWRAFARFNRLVYRHADAVVTYGAHVTRYLIEQGVDSRKIFTSKHAVTNSEYSRHVSMEESSALRRRLEVPAEARIVLFVGRRSCAEGARISPPWIRSDESICPNILGNCRHRSGT